MPNVEGGMSKAGPGAPGRLLFGGWSVFAKPRCPGAQIVIRRSVSRVVLLSPGLSIHYGLDAATIATRSTNCETNSPVAASPSMVDEHFSLASRLTAFSNYHSSNQLGDSITTASLKAIEIPDGSLESAFQPQPAGQMMIRRSISLRREVIDGTCQMQSVTVHIDGDNPDWAWSRRNWRLRIDGVATEGTIQFPACWGFFSFGPYARLTIGGVVSHAEFDVATPCAAPGGFIGYFRNRQSLNWQKMWFLRSSKSASDVPLMFDDTEVFTSLNATEGAMLVAGLMSFAVFSCYFTT